MTEMLRSDFLPVPTLRNFHQCRHTGTSKRLLGKPCSASICFTEGFQSYTRWHPFIDFGEGGTIASVWAGGSD